MSQLISDIKNAINIYPWLFFLVIIPRRLIFEIIKNIKTPVYESLFISIIFVVFFGIIQLIILIVLFAFIIKYISKDKKVISSKYPTKTFLIFSVFIVVLYSILYILSKENNFLIIGGLMILFNIIAYLVWRNKNN